jgi:hypothetical protein
MGDSNKNYISDYDHTGTYFRVDCDSYTPEAHRPLTYLTARCLSSSKLHPVGLFYDPLYLPMLLLKGGDPLAVLRTHTTPTVILRARSTNRGFILSVRVSESNNATLFTTEPREFDIHFTGSTESLLKSLELFHPRCHWDVRYYDDHSKSQYFAVRSAFQNTNLWESDKFSK